MRKFEMRGRMSAMLLSLVAGSAHAQMITPVSVEADPSTAGSPIVAGRAARHVITLGVRQAMTSNGKPIAIEAYDVWKPICSNMAPLSALDLQKMAQSHAAAFADPSKVIIVNSKPTDAGLDLVFVLAGSVPAAAIPAFTAAEAYLQSQFPDDTMTVTIPVSFASLPSGVIGGTSSTSGYVDWATTRSMLVGGMDASDTIQSSLPSGSTIPVRYSTGSTTNETRCFWNWATWKANGGSVSGNDGSMQYSTAFPFDYDPSNGVSSGTISLQDVIIHETGHALGCTSGVDFRFNDIETMDIFRFRRTDGSSDFNPDTATEFGSRPRWAVYNNPNDDVNLDNIASEYRLSDGSPYQASHFREQTPPIGIMDPAFAYGQTFYPNFFLASDVTLFDAIGYNK